MRVQFLICGVGGIDGQNGSRIDVSGPGMAYNVAHGVRALVEQASGRGMSLKTFREQVLRVAAQVLVHGRRVTVVLARRAVAWWHAVLAKLQPLRLWTAQGTS